MTVSGEGKGHEKHSAVKKRPSILTVIKQEAKAVSEWATILVAT